LCRLAHRACVGIVHAVNRAVLRLSVALCAASVGYCILFVYDLEMLYVAIAVLPVSGMVGNYRRTKGKRKIFSFGQQYPLLSFVEDVVDL
jgi:cytochrome b561